MPSLVLNRAQIIFAIACFIFGLILGATASMLYSGNTIDEKVIELETLYSELSERDDRIERLEQSLENRRYQVVKEIKIELNIKDPHLNLKLSDAIRTLLGELIGNEVSSLDPKIVRNIINERIISVNDETYLLKLNYLVISETVYVEIEAKADLTLTE